MCGTKLNASQTRPGRIAFPQLKSLSQLVQLWWAPRMHSWLLFFAFPFLYTMVTVAMLTNKNVCVFSEMTSVISIAFLLVWLDCVRICCGKEFCLHVGGLWQQNLQPILSMWLRVQQPIYHQKLPKLHFFFYFQGTTVAYVSHVAVEQLHVSNAILYCTKGFLVILKVLQQYMHSCMPSYSSWVFLEIKYFIIFYIYYNLAFSTLTKILQERQHERLEVPTECLQKEFSPQWTCRSIHTSKFNSSFPCQWTLDSIVYLYASISSPFNHHPKK